MKGIQQKILLNWKVFDKIVTVITVNAPNTKYSVNEHLKEHHHSSVAHTLNLSVIDALKNEGGGNKANAQKCKNIVTHF